MTQQDIEEEKNSELYPTVGMTKIEEDKKVERLRSLPTMRDVRPTEQESAPHDLNFNTGAAASALQAIVGKEALDNARAVNDIKRKEGDNQRACITNMTKFTAGQLIKRANEYELMISRQQSSRNNTALT